MNSYKVSVKKEGVTLNTTIFQAVDEPAAINRFVKFWNIDPETVNLEDLTIDEDMLIVIQPHIIDGVKQ